MKKEEFVERAREIFGDSYSYELLPKEFAVDTKVPIICKVHDIFYQNASSHLGGFGCNKCGRAAAKKKITSNTEDFIRKAKLKHGDKYDYSKVNYVNNRAKVTIICPIHGEFTKSPNNHLTGQGCRACGIEQRNKSLSDTKEDFIRKANEVHMGKYDYSQVKIKSSSDKVKIICKKHGPFMQMRSNHIAGQGCPVCKSSKGEREVLKWLTENNFDFESQKKFKGCMGKVRPLPFDFYIPSLKTLIEYDGRHHFEFEETFIPLEEWKQLQINDQIKNEFAEREGYRLIRISYKEKVNEVLSKNLL